jgi:hypothetical protein
VIVASSPPQTEAQSLGLCADRQLIFRVLLLQQRIDAPQDDGVDVFGAYDNERVDTNFYTSSDLALWERDHLTVNFTPALLQSPTVPFV